MQPCVCHQTEQTEAGRVPRVRTGCARAQGRNKPVKSQDWAFISGWGQCEAVSWQESFCFIASANMLLITVQSWVPVTEEPAASNPLSECPQPAEKRWCLHSIAIYSGGWEVEARQAQLPEQCSPCPHTWVPSGKESTAGTGHGLPAVQEARTARLLDMALGRSPAAPCPVGAPCSGALLLLRLRPPGDRSCSLTGSEDKSKRRKPRASLPHLLPGPCAVLGFTSLGRGGGTWRGRWI